MISVILLSIAHHFMSEKIDKFLNKATKVGKIQVPSFYIFLQNALILAGIGFYLHRRAKSGRLTRAKLEWLKKRIFRQLHSKEFRILVKMVESDYLQILAFEWVDELGQHVQVRNCHRVTRNYFKNSAAFVRKMKRKIRKKLRELRFSNFNAYFEATAKENKKFNVIDSDDLLSQRVNPRPDPDNFFDDRPFNLENLADAPNRIDELLENEDYPEQVEEEPNPEGFRRPALPKVKVVYEENRPMIAKLEFVTEEQLGKMPVEKQLKRLYEEVNEISLAVEAKLQFLRLDFYRKFVQSEFEEYSRRKEHIDQKLDGLYAEVRESLKGAPKHAREFESEKEALGERPPKRQKGRKKNREGRVYQKKCWTGGSPCQLRRRTALFVSRK